MTTKIAENKLASAHANRFEHAKHLTQLGRTLLFSAACALLLGGTPSYAQALDASQSAAPSGNAVDFLYVSPQGSDSFSGSTPTVSADNGPFQTLTHAQEAVTALTDAGLARPVEVVLDPSVCSAQDFLSRWFPSAPTGSVIWHSDPSRTVLIYTRTLAEQIEALSAEDFAGASGERPARFFVSPTGNDAWSGLLPSPSAASFEKADDAGKTDSAEKSDGPFRSLSRAQEAVNALQAANPAAVVEVVLEEDPARLASSSVFAAAPDKAADKDTKKPSKYTAAGLAALKALASHSGAKSAITKMPIVKTGPAANNVPVLGRGSPRLVFAHYMVCNRDYGWTSYDPNSAIPGYEKEILEAQAAGVDGFALNCGSWNDPYYKQNIASIFAAAAALNNGFKLFFSADMTGLSFQEVAEMMKAYANHPNYWHIQQASGSGAAPRPVLSTWGGEGGTYTNVKGWWQNLVLNPLKAEGINTYFMPFFFTTAANGQGMENTPANTSAQINGLLNGLADGIFNCNSIGVPVDPARVLLSANEKNLAVYKAAGFGTMSSVTPQYWQDLSVVEGRRYVEYDGGEGLAAQWTSIINTQKPDWVELFTWNDFDEATYFSPIDDLNKYWPCLSHTAPHFFETHAGALKLNQYYVNWYKSGVKPAVLNDSLYYFYRTHPKTALATNDTLPGLGGFIGNCTDTIFATTILTAPATLVVTTGSQTLTYPVPAGLSNTRVPFQVGAQSFHLIRKGQTVLSQMGEPIVASPAQYNFNYYTGSAMGQPVTQAHR